MHPMNESSLVQRLRQSLPDRLAHVVPRPEVEINLPLIAEIIELKNQLGASIVAHNYQVPLITSAVADFTGDSLAMARFAAAERSDTVVVCGVRFMAETVKLLCPDKRVLLPSLEAGCSLSESITPEDVRKIRDHCPDIPIIAYVNTSAAVKAEADICCMSANAVAVARSLGSPKVIMLPDRHLAEFVARSTDIEVIAWHGVCEVHTRFTAEDIREYRDGTSVAVLAHPECPAEVQEESDFVGSTGAMVQYLTTRRPQRVLLLTECSMADNVSVQCPEITFLRPCNLCRYMKMITLENIAATLRSLEPEIVVDPAVAERARRPIERMMSVS